MERPREDREPDHAPADAPHVEQPDPGSSSDGDRSWTADPLTADPDEDRSVEAVVERGDHP